MKLFSGVCKKKKSQAEIVGITIVMVLIMLGVVFVIRFVILPSNNNVKADFERTQIASNFVDTLLKMTTTCNDGFTVVELIQDCASRFNEPSHQYSCRPDPICPSGCGSCNYLNKTLEKILNNSLDPLNLRYDLQICDWDPNNLECNTDEPILSWFSRSSCLSSANGQISFDSKQTPIPTNVGNRVVQIYLC